VLPKTTAGRASIQRAAATQIGNVRERSGASIERRIVTNGPEVTTRSLTGSVAALDSDDRAIVDLGMRYGFSDERLAAMLYVDREEVVRRREDLMARLGRDAGIDAETERPRLERALGEVPHDVWLGRADAEADQHRAPAEQAVAAAPRPADDAGRRRPGAWLVTAVAVAAATVALIVVLAGDDDGADPAVTVPVSPGAAPVRLDQLTGTGTTRASIRLARPGPPRVALTLRPLSDHSGAYEVWLYNTVIDAQSLAKIPHGGGTVRFTLPESTAVYRYIDVSEEKPGGFPGHSGRSVARLGLPATRAGLGLGGG
jgi:hypothetical protein